MLAALEAAAPTAMAEYRRRQPSIGALVVAAGAGTAAMLSSGSAGRTDLTKKWRTNRPLHSGRRPASPGHRRRAAGRRPGGRPVGRLLVTGGQGRSPPPLRRVVSGRSNRRHGGVGPPGRWGQRRGWLWGPPPADRRFDNHLAAHPTSPGLIPGTPPGRDAQGSAVILTVGLQTDPGQEGRGDNWSPDRRRPASGAERRAIRQPALGAPASNEGQINGPVSGSTSWASPRPSI